MIGRKQGFNLSDNFTTILVTNYDDRLSDSPAYVNGTMAYRRVTSEVAGSLIAARSNRSISIFAIILQHPTRFLKQLPALDLFLDFRVESGQRWQLEQDKVGADNGRQPSSYGLASDKSRKKSRESESGRTSIDPGLLGNNQSSCLG